MSYTGRIPRRSFYMYREPSSFGIHYVANYALDLRGFTDSNSAGNKIDRKSTYGYSLSLASRPSCWLHKNHDSIALSSVEA